MTPDLLMAVGAVVLEWAMIDDAVTKTLELFWFHHRPEERIPRSFDRRVGHLLEFGDALYANEYSNEVEERRLFRWFIQRLRTANGRRDDIAHGIPGTITIGKKRPAKGLRIPFPSRLHRYVFVKLEHVKALAIELQQLHVECTNVSSALWAAFTASLPNRRSWSDRNGVWTLLTKENRQYRMPSSIPVPATFEVD